MVSVFWIVANVLQQNPDALNRTDLVRHAKQRRNFPVELFPRIEDSDTESMNEAVHESRARS